MVLFILHVLNVKQRSSDNVAFIPLVNLESNLRRFVKADVRYCAKVLY